MLRTVLTFALASALFAVEGNKDPRYLNPIELAVSPDGARL